MPQSDQTYECSEGDLKKLGFQFKGAGRNDLIWLLNHNPSFKMLFKESADFWRLNARVTCFALSIFRKADRETQREIDPDEYVRSLIYLIGDDEPWRTFTGNENNLSIAPEGLKTTIQRKLDSDKLKVYLAKNALSEDPVTSM